MPFIDRMDLAYAAADLAAHRAGAMTCAELAAVGLPAVYVPLPIGNGEQRVNALPVVSAGGGLLVDGRGASLRSGSPTWPSRCCTMGSRLRTMGAAAYGHGVRDADDQLARIVLRVACGR